MVIPTQGYRREKTTQWNALKKLSKRKRREMADLNLAISGVVPFQEAMKATLPQMTDETQASSRLDQAEY